MGPLDRPGPRREHPAMRTLALATLLALTALAPARPVAEEPPRLELEVGEQKAVGGFRPLCDDPSIAWFSEDGKGLLRGLKVGTTTCSVSAGSPMGARRVYRVVVVPPVAKAGDPSQPGGTPGRQGR